MKSPIEIQPGFVSRRRSRTADGTWIGHLERGAMAAAKGAAARIGKSETAAPLTKAISGSIVQMVQSQVEALPN